MIHKTIALIGGGKGFDIARYYLKNVEDTIPEIIGPYGDNCALTVPMLNELPKDVQFLITFSKNMERRREIYKAFQGKYKFTNLVRSNLHGCFGEGNIIFPGVICDFEAEIGNNNVISCGVVINHHCKVGDGCLLGPGVMMAGSVTIEDNCSIGAGVTLTPGVTIGEGVRIVDGAHVMTSQPAGKLVKAKTYNGIITDYIC